MSIRSLDASCEAPRAERVPRREMLYEEQGARRRLAAMTCIYNEIEAYPVEWLGNLINAGLIADGLVDSRSIAGCEPWANVTAFMQSVGAWQ